MYTLLPPSLFRRLCSVIFSGTRWITTAIVTGTASIVLRMKNSRLVIAAEETRKEKKKLVGRECDLAVARAQFTTDPDDHTHTRTLT